jgi:hypothetical protein
VHLHLIVVTGIDGCWIELSTSLREGIRASAVLGTLTRSASRKPVPGLALPEVATRCRMLPSGLNMPQQAATSYAV